VSVVDSEAKQGGSRTKKVRLSFTRYLLIGLMHVRAGTNAAFVLPG
jgi:hypothetical protein